MSSSTHFSTTSSPPTTSVESNQLQKESGGPRNCEIGVSSARLAKAQSSRMASNCSYGSASVAVAASVSGFDPPKESVHIAGKPVVAAACTADRWLLSFTWTPNLNKLWAEYRLSIQNHMKLLTTSDTCGYIIQCPRALQSSSSDSHSISGHECASAWLPPLYREQIRQAATQEGSAECLPQLFMQWPSPFCGQFSAKPPDHR